MFDEGMMLSIVTLIQFGLIWFDKIWFMFMFGLGSSVLNCPIPSTCLGLRGFRASDDLFSFCTNAIDPNLGCSILSCPVHLARLQRMFNQIVPHHPLPSIGRGFDGRCDNCCGWLLPILVPYLFINALWWLAQLSFLVSYVNSLLGFRHGWYFHLRRSFQTRSNAEREEEQ